MGYRFPIPTIPGNFENTNFKVILIVPGDWERNYQRDIYSYIGRRMPGKVIHIISKPLVLEELKIPYQKYFWEKVLHEERRRVKLRVTSGRYKYNILIKLLVNN